MAYICKVNYINNWALSTEICVIVNNNVTT